jgi:hypothetical protein
MSTLNEVGAGYVAEKQVRDEAKVKMILFAWKFFYVLVGIILFILISRHIYIKKYGDQSEYQNSELNEIDELIFNITILTICCLGSTIYSSISSKEPNWNSSGISSIVSIIQIILIIIVIVIGYFSSESIHNNVIYTLNNIKHQRDSSSLSDSSY